jgi:hypothetical protein
VRLYRTLEGGWAGTQADAGPGFTQVEVPTDKPGLLAWLNEQAETERRRMGLASMTAADDAMENGTCALCQRDHAKSKRAAEKLAAGMEADAIAERMRAMPAFAMLTVLHAAIERLTELKED